MGLNPKTVKLEHVPGVFSATSGIVYEYTDTSISRTKPGEKKIGDIKYVPWGKDNLLPYHNLQVIAESDTKQQLINADVDLACGKGLIFYKRNQDEDGDGLKDVEYIIDPVLENWKDDWMLEDFYSETMQDLKTFGNSWPEFILSRDKSKVNSILSQDAVDCRLALPTTRRDSSVLLIADWKYNRLRQEDIKKVHLLDIKNPQLGNHHKCAYHLKFNYSGQPFYSLVDWHGARTWEEVASFIPKFHKSGLKGGYSLRYHIKIPITYLEQRVSAIKDDDLTEEQAAVKIKTEIQESLDAVLSGAENAQKAFFSWINDNVPGNPVGWEIEKIETDLKDDSYIKLDEHADKKRARGHNIHPVLAGIETSGNLSSGSEILNLVNFHIAYKTPRARRLALRPLNMVLKYNFKDKWNQGIRIGTEDVLLTTIDKNPKGKEAVTSDG